MLGIGLQELLLIAVVAVVVVGPKKLPELAKSLGKGLQEFKKATEGIKSSLNQNEAYRDLQNIKNTMHDTVSSLNPTGLLDNNAKPPATSAPEPAPELKKFEAPAPLAEESATPLLEPKKPEEKIEGRLAVMDGIISEHHQPPTTAPASPEGQPQAAAQAAVPTEEPAAPAAKPAVPTEEPAAPAEGPAAASSPAPGKANA